MNAELEISQGLAAMQIACSDDQVAALLGFLQLIERWNSAYNLTAINELATMIPRHVFDSASVLPHLKGQRFADVGTGAGLPGIPLAILAPDKQFALIETSGKRTRFLLQVVSELSLTNVTVHKTRAEQYHPEQLFDGVLSRAFASLEQMLRLTQHLCSDSGRFYAMKGAYPEKELSEISKDYIVLEALSLNVPQQPGERHLLIIQKRMSS